MVARKKSGVKLANVSVVVPKSDTKKICTKIMPIASKSDKLLVEKVISSHVKLKSAKLDYDDYTSKLKDLTNKFFIEESIEAKKSIGSFFVGDKTGDFKIQIVPADKWSNITAEKNSTDPQSDIDEKLNALDKILDFQYSDFVETKTEYKLKSSFVKKLESNKTYYTKFKNLLKDNGYEDIFTATETNIVKKGATDIAFSCGKQKFDKISAITSLQQPSLRVIPKKIPFDE